MNLRVPLDIEAVVTLARLRLSNARVAWSAADPDDRDRYTKEFDRASDAAMAIWDARELVCNWAMAANIRARRGEDTTNEVFEYDAAIRAFWTLTQSQQRAA